MTGHLTKCYLKSNTEMRTGKSAIKNSIRGPRTYRRVLGPSKKKKNQFSEIVSQFFETLSQFLEIVISIF